MSGFEQQLHDRLEVIRNQDLLRQLRRIDSNAGTRITMAGVELLNFSSNDYLGLAHHPAVKHAAAEALERFGAGAGSSRLICGNFTVHEELEMGLASFKKAAAALVFSSGYAAALGTISALVDHEDVIILDKLVHASIVDAARLSGAKLRVFPHNDLEGLDRVLRWARNRPETRNILVATESVFSMDGDTAPLLNIVRLKEQYGAWLMVDEAHATGFFGPNRRGLAEQLGVSDRIEIQMGTLGKSLGSVGGYICGSRNLVDLLINRSRSFIFSTAPTPANCAAAHAALRIVDSPEGGKLATSLWERVASVGQALGRKPGSAIFPVVVGSESRALETAAALRSAGIFVPAIRYPAVARGAARLRVTLSAAHSPANISRVLTALRASGVLPLPEPAVEAS